MESENSGILTSCSVSDSILMNPVNEIVDKMVKSNDIEEEYFLVQEESTELQINEMDDDEIDKLSEMCRICGSVNERLVPIFKDDGLEHDFCSKIKKHLPIEVSETDVLPLQLCYQCAATLLAWDELSEGVLSAQSRLLRLQEQAEQRRLEIFEDAVKAEENKQFFKKDSTVEQKPTPQAEINENPKTERSSALLKIETNPKQRIEHFTKKCASVLRMHSKLPENQNTRTDPGNSKNPEIFNTKNSIVENLESDSREFAETSKNPAKSDSEKETLSPSGNEKCGEKFQSRQSTEKQSEKMYTCHVCGKQFGLTGSLYYHLRHVHGGVKNHSCDICGRCFATKSTLDDHRRIHTGERPFVCDSCGKTFKTKASLYIHRRTHTNDYPHECSFCKRGFRWKQQMLDHLTIHTRVKNHICDICGKAFGVKNHLTRHRKIHTSEKPFTCLQCGLKFGQKRYLKTHERLRHG